jgi:hypothetical protein
VVVSCGTPTTNLTMTTMATSTTTTTPSVPKNRENDQADIVLRSLLLELEERARQNGATELILLAYLTTTTTSGSRASSTRPRRPTAALVQGLGYQRLPINLKGVEAVQFYKALHTASPNDDDKRRGGVTLKEKTVNDDSKSATGDKSSRTEAMSTAASLLSTLVLFCALVVGRVTIIEAWEPPCPFKNSNGYNVTKPCNAPTWMPTTTPEAYHSLLDPGKISVQKNDGKKLH